MLGIGLALAVLLALGLGALLASLRPRHKPRDALAAAQLRLQRRLARVGIVRGISEGPRDFYRRTATELSDSAPTVNRLAAEYLALRYAFAEPPPERIRAFLHAIRNFHPRRVVK
jgi:hypothetical protein